MFYKLELPLSLSQTTKQPLVLKTHIINKLLYNFMSKEARNIYENINFYKLELPPSLSRAGRFQT